MSSWYQDDSFWITWQPYLFSAGRVMNTGYEVDRLIQLLELAAGDRVLDICCGWGRHAMELSRRGYRVTGVDRVESYLAAARSQAEAEELPLEVVALDVRQLDLEAEFDAAINMYTSFGYFEDYRDDLRLARNARESLKPGGRFLIQTEGKEIMARNFRPREWYRHDDGTIGLHERTIRDGWEMMDTRWLLLRDGYSCATAASNGTE
jgi:SAM-dependent methyltransferase